MASQVIDHQLGSGAAAAFVDQHHAVISKTFIGSKRHPVLALALSKAGLAGQHRETFHAPVRPHCGGSTPCPLAAEIEPENGLAFALRYLALQYRLPVRERQQQGF